MTGSVTEEKRVALIGIIVKDDSEISRLNEILHEASEYIIGRMGVPYREGKVNIISIAVDAPQDVISALSGRIGRLNGISSKVLYAPANQ